MMKDVFNFGRHVVVGVCFASLILTSSDNSVPYATNLSLSRWTNEISLHNGADTYVCIMQKKFWIPTMTFLSSLCFLEILELGRPAFYTGIWKENFAADSPPPLEWISG